MFKFFFCAPKLCALNRSMLRARDLPLGYFIPFMFCLAFSLMAGTNYLMYVFWPDCAYGDPCEQRKTRAQVLHDVARRVVPSLRDHGTEFSTLGVGLSQSENDSRDCFESFVAWLTGELGDFVSDPSLIVRITEVMQIRQFSTVQFALGELLTQPVDYSAVVRLSELCARENPLLASFMCAALDDEELRPSYVAEYVSVTAHLYLVLERLASVSGESPGLLNTLNSHFVRISDHVVSALVSNARSAGESEEVAEGRVQQWYSAASGTPLALALKQEPLVAAMRLQESWMLSVLQAAYVDKTQGLDASVDLSLAIATDVLSHHPYVDEKSAVLWPLGKDWIDAYVAWNLNHVTQFQSMLLHAPLLIPSVLCSSEHVDVTLTGGWLSPLPEEWSTARMTSLLAATVYVNFQQEASGTKITDSVSMSRHARQTWGDVSLGHANLPAPPRCCEGVRMCVAALFSQTCRNTTICRTMRTLRSSHPLTFRSREVSSC